MYHHVFMFLFTPGMGVNRARRAYIIIYKGACAPSVPRAMSCHFERLKITRFLVGRVPLARYFSPLVAENEISC